MNNTTITNTNNRQNGDTTITVEETIDGNVAYSSVRFYFSSDAEQVVSHTLAVNGVVTSSGRGYPETGPLTEELVQSERRYWQHNVTTRIYHQ